MSGDDVTPAEARAAARVLRRLNEHEFTGGDRIEHGVWAPGGLDAYADRIEATQAEKAKRDKRVEELAGELRQIGRELPRLVTWEDTAAFLLDRYPSLLDEDGER